MKNSKIKDSENKENSALDEIIELGASIESFEEWCLARIKKKEEN